MKLQTAEGEEFLAQLDMDTFFGVVAGMVMAEGVKENLELTRRKREETKDQIETLEGEIVKHRGEIKSLEGEIEKLQNLLKVAIAIGAVGLVLGLIAIGAPALAWFAIPMAIGGGVWAGTLHYSKIAAARDGIERLKKTIATKEQEIEELKPLLDYVEPYGGPRARFIVRGDWHLKFRQTTRGPIAYDTSGFWTDDFKMETADYARAIRTMEALVFNEKKLLQAKVNPLMDRHARPPQEVELVDGEKKSVNLVRGDMEVELSHNFRNENLVLKGVLDKVERISAPLIPLGDATHAHGEEIKQMVRKAASVDGMPTARIELDRKVSPDEKPLAESLDKICGTLTTRQETKSPIVAEMKKNNQAFAELTKLRTKWVVNELGRAIDEIKNIATLQGQHVYCRNCNSDLVEWYEDPKNRELRATAKEDEQTVPSDELQRTSRMYMFTPKGEREQKFVCPHCGEIEECRVVGQLEIGPDSVADWRAFLSAILERGADKDEPSPASRLLELAAEQEPEVEARMRGILAEPQMDEDKLPPICEALNAVLGREDFYREACFACLRVPPDAQRLLSKRRQEDLTPDQVRRLNRLLLEEAFPDVVPSSRFSVRDLVLRHKTLEDLLLRAWDQLWSETSVMQNANDRFSESQREHRDHCIQEIQVLDDILSRLDRDLTAYRQRLSSMEGDAAAIADKYEGIKDAFQAANFNLDSYIGRLKGDTAEKLESTLGLSGQLRELREDIDSKTKGCKGVRDRRHNEQENTLNNLPAMTRAIVGWVPNPLALTNGSAVGEESPHGPDRDAEPEPVEDPDLEAESHPVDSPQA